MYSKCNLMQSFDVSYMACLPVGIPVITYMRLSETYFQKPPLESAKLLPPVFAQSA